MYLFCPLVLSPIFRAMRSTTDIQYTRDERVKTRYLSLEADGKNTYKKEKSDKEEDGRVS